MHSEDCTVRLESANLILDFPRTAPPSASWELPRRLRGPKLRKHICSCLQPETPPPNLFSLHVIDFLSSRKGGIMHLFRLDPLPRPCSQSCRRHSGSTWPIQISSHYRRHMCAAGTQLVKARVAPAPTRSSWLRQQTVPVSARLHDHSTARNLTDHIGNAFLLQNFGAQNR